MTDLWKDKVTIYNDIPANGKEQRRFDRFVVDKCSVQGGFDDKTTDTVRKVVNTKTVITKDIVHYKQFDDYIALNANDRDNYYTASVGDFIVFGIVEDTVNSAQEFMQLQNKYKNNGIKIVSVNQWIKGMYVDNITMSNV